MKRTSALFAILVCCALPAYALYTVKDRGEWPKTWPGELEPLRKQSRTLEGPEVLCLHYGIRFNNRQEFEAAWKHLLKVKTRNSPIFLESGENFFLGDHSKAGVVVHCPPAVKSKDTPDGLIPGSTGLRERWMYTNYIDLVVDDDIVNLKRIELPRGVPIIDERKKDKESKDKESKDKENQNGAK